MQTIDTLLTIKIIHEADATDAPFVAYIPEFDISSCGPTQDSAITHVKEALNITLEEAEKDGTIIQLLAESGFSLSSRKSGSSRSSHKSRTVATERPRIVVEPFAFAL